MEIKINNSDFHLDASGALFWQEKGMLVISDVHLGKISHFRKHGFALPQQAVQVNFWKLNELIVLYKPQQIVFLGDLFHSKINSEWSLFSEWLLGITASVVLVEGNHDIISPEKYKEVGVKVVQDLCIDGFLFTHHPEASEAYFNFCGHIHPGIKIRGAGRQSISLPCFFWRGNQLILPAFGTFTGKYFLERETSDTVYAIAENTIIKIV